MCERIIQEHLIAGRPAEEYIFAGNPLPCGDEIPLLQIAVGADNPS